MTLLEVRGLRKSFGGIRAVDGVDFELAAGEMLALIGPNGAGKSTTFDMVNGQLRPDAGSVRLGDAELVGLRPRAIRRLGVGRTFQVAQTFVSLTVVENVQAALLSADGKTFSWWRQAARWRRDDAVALLEQVGMASQADRPCSELAYGDVKRVELAIALADAPRLLLMDEPTAGMAPAERGALMSLVRRLVVERGMAALFTEHSMDVVFAHADRVVVLARGRVVAEGPPERIRADPQVQAVYFGTGRTFGAYRAAADAPPSRLGPSALAAAGSITPAPAGTPASAGANHDVLLGVQGLSAWHGAAQVLFDVDLQVRRGEVVALMGRNGAGKSTTLEAIMGLLERRRGAVKFMGNDLSKARPREIAALGLGFVPEDRRIFTDLTVAQNLAIGRQAPRRWPDGTPAPTWTPQRLYALFPNLGEMTDRAGGRMSGGEQQMLTVARTLMGNPYLVLLDEPSEGVAPVVVEQMADAILALKAQGMSVLLSEQNMHFAQLVCDRAYVLEKGQVRFAGTMAQLEADREVRQACLGP